MPEHNVITDPEIHEPKGASSAAADQVYVSNGAGSGTWTDVYAAIQSQRCSADALLEPGSPQTVTINTIGVFESIGGAGFTSDFADESITFSSAGVGTYTNAHGARVLVTGRIVMATVGGGGDELEVRLSQNGTTIPVSGSRHAAATASEFTFSALMDLVNTDTIEVEIANNTTTANIDVTMCKIDVIGF